MSAGKSKRPTAPQWFGRADEFWTAAEIFGMKGENGPVIPNVVCRAFSAEAYLKCLLTVRQKHYPHDHDLHLLFGLLPLDDKHAIEKAWNQHSLPLLQAAKARTPKEMDSSLIPSTLNQALKSAANAFKDWRYRVDGPRAFMLNAFPLHVRDEILMTHPDWLSDPPDSYGNQSKARAQKSAAGQAEADAAGVESLWRIVPGRPG